MATDPAPEIRVVPRDEAAALHHRKGEWEAAAPSTRRGQPIEINRDRPAGS